MTLSEELESIHKKQKDTVEEEVMNLFSAFISSSPVETGAFRSAWSISKNADGSWTITNDVIYASILWDGRQLVAGRWYGSEQWSDGGQVMIEKFNRTLQEKLDRIL